MEKVLVRCFNNCIWRKATIERRETNGVVARVVDDVWLLNNDRIKASHERIIEKAAAAASTMEMWNMQM